MNPTIRCATVDDVDAIAPLFNHYRMFYDQPSDEALAHRFIGERLQRVEGLGIGGLDVGEVDAEHHAVRADLPAAGAGRATAPDWR